MSSSGSSSTMSLSVSSSEPLTILSPCSYGASSCGYCSIRKDPNGKRLRTKEKTSWSYGVWAHSLSARIYQELIDRGWRRSGHYIYHPDNSKTCCPQLAIRLIACGGNSTDRSSIEFWRRIGKEGGEGEKNETKLGLNDDVELDGVEIEDEDEGRLNFKIGKSHRQIINRFNRFVQTASLPTPTSHNSNQTPNQNNSTHSIHNLQHPDYSDTQFIPPKTGKVFKPAKLEREKKELVEIVRREREVVSGGDEKREGEEDEGKGDRGSGLELLPQVEKKVHLNPKAPFSPSNPSFSSHQRPNLQNTRSQTPSQKRKGKNNTPFDLVKELTKIDWENQQASVEIQEGEDGSSNKKGKGKEKVGGTTTKPKYRFQTALIPSSSESHFSLRFELYKLYQITVHNDPKNKVTEEGFRRFLCQSPIGHQASLPGSPPYGSYHLLYLLTPNNGRGPRRRDYLDYIDSSNDSGKEEDNDLGIEPETRLIGLAVIDILPKGVSSVYFCWDPTDGLDRLGLGKYSALREIVMVKQLRDRGFKNMKFYCMGFYIHSCVKMRYKADYQPSELLDPDTNIFYPFQEAKEILDNDLRASLSGTRKRPADRHQSTSHIHAETDLLDGIGNPPDYISDFDSDSDEDEDDDFPSLPTDPPIPGTSNWKDLPPDVMREGKVLERGRGLGGRLGLRRFKDSDIYHRDGSGKRSALECFAALGDDLAKDDAVALFVPVGVDEDN